LFIHTFAFLHQLRFQLFHWERSNIFKDTVTRILHVELSAFIRTRNNEKISEADKLILDGKFFIKLPELLRPQRTIGATDRSLTRVTVMTIVCQASDIILRTA
jgi:hypothetical protein